MFKMLSLRGEYRIPCSDDVCVPESFGKEDRLLEENDRKSGQRRIQARMNRMKKRTYALGRHREGMNAVLSGRKAETSMGIYKRSLDPSVARWRSKIVAIRFVERCKTLRGREEEGMDLCLVSEVAGSI